MKEVLFELQGTFSNIKAKLKYLWAANAALFC